MNEFKNAPLEVVLSHIDAMRQGIVEAAERGGEFDISMQIHTIPEGDDLLILGSTSSITSRLKGVQIPRGE